MMVVLFGFWVLTVSKGGVDGFVASTLSVVEKDQVGGSVVQLWYRQQQEEKDDHNAPGCLRDDQAEHMPNHVYIASELDTAGILMARSGGRVGQKGATVASNAMADCAKWITETNSQWPACCARVNCNHKPKVVAHIAVQGKSSSFLVPMCERCHMQQDYQLCVKVNGSDVMGENQTQQTTTWQYPFSLREDTACLHDRPLQMTPFSCRRSNPPAAAAAAAAAARAAVGSSYIAKDNTILCWNESEWKRWTFADIYSLDSEYCRRIYDEAMPTGALARHGKEHNLWSNLGVDPKSYH